MLSFLLSKPTQFDAPFFRWLHANRPEMPFVVYYWQPVQHAAATDTETGASLQWGIDLLGGYPWVQVHAKNPDAFATRLRQDGVRYLISNGWKAGFAPLVAVAQKAGIPLGLRIDSVLWDKPKYEILLRRIYLHRAYKPFRHFFSSGTVGDDYLRAIGIPQTQWRRWPYCVDVDFFRTNAERLAAAGALRQQYGLDARPVVLSVCKWVPRENPLELLKAFTILSPANLQLVMIGDGPLRPEMEALRARYPHLTIVFPGYMPYVQLPDWYALSTVYVHPAQYEPWGVSVHEAIAAGCRVVASNRVGSGYDLIIQGANGFQYPVGDVAGLAQYIEKAILLPEDVLTISNEEILTKWQYEAVAIGLGNLP
jgi:glycosyltransferase involved in cell wall biosynthesis